MRYISGVITILSSVVFALPIHASPIKKCPSGGRLRGQPPPQGQRQWCVADDLFGRSRKNGPLRVWHANGALRIEGEFVDDKRNGVWKFYSKDGRLAMEKSYRFGELAGETKRQLAGKAPQSRADPDPRPPPAVSPSSSFDQSTPSSWDEDEENAPTRTESSFGTRLATDLSIYSGDGLGIYRPAFEATFRISQFTIEAQWGLGILSFETDTNVEPLNPAFFFTYVLEHAMGSVQTGVGASIPVHSIEANEDSIEGLATVIASGLPTGLWDLWLYLPEFPIVALTTRADFNLSFLIIDAELTPYLTIPTNSDASTELSLQAAVDLAYPILELLHAGARVQTVLIGITEDVQGLVNVEPFVKGRFGPGFARLGFEINVLRPDVFSSGGLDGLLWSLNLGLGVEI